MIELKYVYIMRGTKWNFKIGISNDPERRLTEVSHNPKLISTYRFFNAHSIEKILHTIFNRDRITRSGSGKTEWFMLGVGGIIRLRLTLLFFKIIHDAIIGAVLVALVIFIIWFFKNNSV